MPQMLLSLLFAAGAALALDAGSGGAPPAAPPPKHHGPPPEAIAACANLKVDEACSFKLHDHDIAGTCQARHDDAGALACRPAHPRRHHPHHDDPGAAPPPAP